MSVIFLLIGAGAVVAGGFLAAFVWAVRSGQYDDITTPAVRMLLDHSGADAEPPRPSPSSDTAKGRPHA